MTQYSQPVENSVEYTDCILPKDVGSITFDCPDVVAQVKCILRDGAIRVVEVRDPVGLFDVSGWSEQLRVHTKNNTLCLTLSIKNGRLHLLYSPDWDVTYHLKTKLPFAPLPSLEGVRSHVRLSLVIGTVLCALNKALVGINPPVTLVHPTEERN